MKGRYVQRALARYRDIKARKARAESKGRNSSAADRLVITTDTTPLVSWLIKSKGHTRGNVVECVLTEDGKMPEDFIGVALQDPRLGKFTLNLNPPAGLPHRSAPVRRVDAQPSFNDAERIVEPAISSPTPEITAFRSVGFSGRAPVGFSLHWLAGLAGRDAERIIDAIVVGILRRNSVPVVFGPIPRAFVTKVASLREAVFLEHYGFDSAQLIELAGMLDAWIGPLDPAALVAWQARTPGLYLIPASVEVGATIKAPPGARIQRTPTLLPTLLSEIDSVLEDLRSGGWHPRDTKVKPSAKVPKVPLRWRLKYIDGRQFLIWIDIPLADLRLDIRNNLVSLLSAITDRWNEARFVFADGVCPDVSLAPYTVPSTPLDQGERRAAAQETNVILASHNTVRAYQEIALVDILVLLHDQASGDGVFTFLDFETMALLSSPAVFNRFGDAFNRHRDSAFRQATTGI